MRLEIEVGAAAWPALVEAASFERMSARAETLSPPELRFVQGFHGAGQLGCGPVDGDPRCHRVDRQRRHRGRRRTPFVVRQTLATWLSTFSSASQPLNCSDELATTMRPRPTHACPAAHIGQCSPEVYTVARARSAGVRFATAHWAIANSGWRV